MSIWTRVERRFVRCRQFGVLTLLFLLFFLILPTVWIQNAMMLRQLRNGRSLLALMVASDNNGGSGSGDDGESLTIDLEKRMRLRNGDGAVVAMVVNNSFHRPGGHVRSLTPREFLLFKKFQRDRKLTFEPCQSLDLPAGPTWEHPRWKKSHDGHHTTSTTDSTNDRESIPLTVVVQYPNLLTAAVELIGKSSSDAIVHLPREIKSRPATLADLEERQGEYHYALAHTLMHPAVSRVHLLMNDTARDVPVLLRGLAAFCDFPALETLPKLRFRGVGMPVTYGVAFAHVNMDIAAGSAVLFMNSDIYPVGRGWTELRARHLIAPPNGSRVFYMISRYTPPCPPGWSSARQCRTTARFGSADGLLFRAPVPSAVVEELWPIPPYYWGAENRAASAFVRAGHALPRNPCDQLALWHHHCSGVRTAGPNIPRVNRGTGHSRRSRWVPCLDDVP